MLTSHQNYMQQALELAVLGRYTASPNPMVGCVIVKAGEVIGKGYHQRAGEGHAEIHALAEAGERASGATAYITLEPCCHHGRTPPCTDALIKAGIKHVYTACLDPNPLVAGKGVETLRQAGITAEVGLCEQAAKELNKIFIHYMATKRPYVIAKWAMSLDGKTITHPEDDKQISSATSQQLTHDIRQQVDAILIGSQTAIQDDPLLTVRYAKEIIKQPIRIILCSGTHLPLNLKLFDTTLPGKTMVAATDKFDATCKSELNQRNIDVITLNTNKDGRISIPHLLDTLGQQQITSLLVEGGMTLHEDFFRENCVNQTHVFVAPVIIGSHSKKLPLNNIHLEKLGCDIYLTASEET